MARDGNRTATITDKKLGELIKSRRRALGISQTALGEKIGVTFRQVQKYEAGLNRISIGRLELIAAALGVQVAEFLPSQANPSPSEEQMLAQFLLLPEAQDLIKAFSAIDDAKSRQHLVELATILSSKT